MTRKRNYSNKIRLFSLVDLQMQDGPGLKCVNTQVVPGPSRTGKGFDLMDDATPTSLYRYYDGRGVLLYVGITSRGMSRNTEHNNTQPWWPYVASQEVQHFSDRPAALKAEKGLIRRHRPPFNKQHNPDKGHLADKYVELRSLETPGRSAGVVMSQNRGRLRMQIVSRDGNLLRCVAVKEDLSLATRINLGITRFNKFALPNGLIGHVVDWRRHGYLLEMTLRGAWVDRVEAVSAIVDKKKLGYFIRSVEVQMDGAWIAAKPQRVSADPYEDGDV